MILSCFVCFFFSHSFSSFPFVLPFSSRVATAAELWSEDYVDEDEMPETVDTMLEDEERSSGSRDVDSHDSLAVIPQSPARGRKKNSPASKASTLSMFSKNLFKKKHRKEDDDDDDDYDTDSAILDSDDQIRRYTVRDETEDWR